MQCWSGEWLAPIMVIGGLLQTGAKVEEKRFGGGVEKGGAGWTE